MTTDRYCTTVPPDTDTSVPVPRLPGWQVPKILNLFPHLEKGEEADFENDVRMQKIIHLHLCRRPISLFTLHSSLIFHSSSIHLPFFTLAHFCPFTSLRNLQRRTPSHSAYCFRTPKMSCFMLAAIQRIETILSKNQHRQHRQASPSISITAIAHLYR